MTDGPSLRPVRLPTGLLGMLALVLMIERLIASHDALFITPHEHDWRIAGNNATTQARGVDILILGDSMLKFGLSPVVLEDQLGRSAYSLALLDGKPAATFFLLRRALAAGARPRILLVDFQPECLYQPTSTLSVNRHWKSLLNEGEALDYARNYGDAEFFHRIVVARWLPSYRCRTELRNQVLLTLGGKQSPNPVDNAKVARNRNRNQGGLLLPPDPTYRGEVLPAFAESLYSADWFQRPENVRYVRRFMSLARDHGIPVVWVIPPNVTEVESTRARIGLSDRYDAFLRGVMARYSNLHVFDGRRAGIEAKAFIDPVHLNRHGAVRFSRMVGERLGRLLDAGPSSDVAARWVQLDSGYRPDVPLVLEDMDQSREALMAIGAATTAKR